MAEENLTAHHETTSDTLTIVARTKFRAVLQTPISSKLSEVGDLLYWTLSELLRIDTKHVLQRGTELLGKVTYVKRAGRVKGKTVLYALMDGLEMYYGTKRHQDHCGFG